MDDDKLKTILVFCGIVFGIVMGLLLYVYNLEDQSLIVPVKHTVQATQIIVTEEGSWSYTLLQFTDNETNTTCYMYRNSVGISCVR